MCREREERMGRGEIRSGGGREGGSGRARTRTTAGSGKGDVKEGE